MCAIASTDCDRRRLKHVIPIHVGDPKAPLSPSIYKFAPLPLFLTLHVRGIKPGVPYLTISDGVSYLEIPLR